MQQYPSSGSRINPFLFFLLLGGLALLSSCRDNEDTGAAPVIERVRFTDPATADSSFTKATLGSNLAIVGKNLSTAQYVLLNNYKIAVNPVFATDNYLLIPVLDSVPTVAQDPNVPNELTVVNRYGQATFKFQVLPPAPVLEQVGNQFVRAGETVTLFGKYFFFVEEVTFPGGVTVTDFTTNANGTALTVKVPEGFDPTKGDIIVTTQSGASMPGRTSRFYSGEGIVSNFDDIFPWGWGLDKDKNVTTVAPGGVIQPLDNKFALINMSLPENYGWSNDKVINLVDWGGNQTYPTAPSNKYNPEAPIANFDARMEVAVVTGASLEGVQLQVFYQNQNNVEMTANVDLKNFIRSTDGKWYTVSVPLSSLANGNVKLTRYGDILTGNKDSQHHFRVVIVNTTPAAVPAMIAIDNVRVVNAVMQ